MSPVVSYTNSRYIKKLESTNKFAAIEELAGVFEGSDVCSDVGMLVKALKEREEILSTGIGLGIAIPHAKISAVKEMTFAIGISRKGISFDSLDGNPAKIIILVAAGERQHKEYLRLLSNIMAILKNETIKKNIIEAESAEEIIKYLQTEDK
jgi:mannitol/fructose-specific phosphotransferase system IIA component (Ntr-type)